MKNWEELGNVAINFLGNYKSENYVEMVPKLVDTFMTLGANMSIKLHYLHSQLDRFPEKPNKGKDSTRI